MTACWCSIAVSQRSDLCFEFERRAERDRADADERALERPSHGTGAGHVLSHVGATIDTAEDEIRQAVGHDVVVHRSSPSRRPAAHGIGLVADLAHTQRLVQRQRVALADWLASGATTVMSSESLAAICRSACRPGASMPSLLVTRMRIFLLTYCYREIFLIDPVFAC